MTHYQFSNKEVEVIVQDWTKEWRFQVEYDQLSTDEEVQQYEPLTEKDGVQGENPPQENPESTHNDSSMTPTYPVVGKKRKQIDKSIRSNKKRKYDKSTGTVSLTNNDYTLLMDTMEKVSNQSLKKIDERKIELTSSIT